MVKKSKSLDQHDFFISYAEADRAWAEWIAVELEAVGYTTVVQAFDFRPSSDFLREMEQAVEHADRMIAVVSAGYFASDYCTLEWRAGIVKDPTGVHRYLLPIRVQEVSLPDLYASRVYTDLADHSEIAARKKLLAAANRHRPRPAHRAFPGGLRHDRTVVGQTQRRLRFPASGPGVTNVPARNRHFTGREDALGQLYADLNMDRVAAVVPTSAVHGLGGIGKTQLALEYSHRYVSDYDIIWWINAERATTTIAGLASLARRLDIPEGSDQNETVDALLDQLRSHGHWLLVYDNAEQPNHLEGLLPPGGEGHVLITSRWSAWSEQATAHALGVMRRKESLHLLRDRIPTPSPRESELEELAELLGDLPLALNEAAAFLEQTGEGITDYVGLVRTRAHDLFGASDPADGVGGESDRRRIATVWSVALDKIHGSAPMAESLLNLLAFLAPEVPRSLLAEVPEALPDDIARVIRDRLLYDRTLAVLGRYSLVTLTPTSVSLHRLVQTVIQARLARRDAELYASAALMVVSAAFPRDSSELECWGECERLLPQLLAATEHTQLYQIASTETVDLLSKGSDYLNGRGHYRAAEPLAGQALQLAKSTLDPLSEKLAAAHNRYGVVLRNLRDYANARAHIESAIQITAASHGPDDIHMAAWRTSLGGVLYYLSDLEGARYQHEEAIRIHDLVHGPDHPSSAVCRINLGGVLTQLGELEAARVQIEQAIRTGDVVHGPDHPEMARWRNNLASLFEKMGNLGSANAELERVIDITEHTLGPDHPDMAQWRGNHGRVLRKQGDLGAARVEFEAAIRIVETSHGPDHPDLASWRNSLGELLYRLDDLDAARNEFLAVIRITETHHGPDHPDLVKWRNNLGIVLDRLGDLGAARIEFEAAIRIVETSHGPDYPDLASWRNSLGDLLYRLDDLDAARNEFLAAIRIVETHHGPDHPDMAHCRNNLGVILDSLGDPGAARAEYEAAIRITEAHHGPDHPDVAKWRNNLGIVLDRLGDLDAARIEFEAAIRIVEADHGPDHPDVVKWRNNLGIVLDRLGDLDTDAEAV